MKHFLRIAALLALFLPSSGAWAAACFWVGTGGVAGGGTYSTTNAVNWASSSNGANSSCVATGGVPKNSGDIAHFDAAANGIGSGTVTMDSSMDGTTFATINTTLMSSGATLDLNGRNFTLTNQFSASGTGTRTITCGSSSIAFTNSGVLLWDLATSTNSTINCSSASFTFNSSAGGGIQTFAGGTSKSYGTLTINGRTSAVEGAITATTGVTFANLIVNGAARIVVPQATPVTVTGNFTLGGTSTGLVQFSSSNTNSGVAAAGLTLTGASISASWAAIKQIAVTGGAISGTAIFDMGGNTNVTGSAPPSSGGGKIIGG